ncbi:MAG: hypothetical protein Q8O41_04250 [Candidatus Methanoperedens sp.]|nr:hypothetical protein [Candidatus Methanoperedens sp.]
MPLLHLVAVLRGTPYRRELSSNPNLTEANASYRKAIDWLDKAECSSIPVEAQRSYRTAGSYVSDAIFKLKKAGYDNNINVSEDVYYCEKIKRETGVKITKGAISPHQYRGQCNNCHVILKK